MANHLSFMISRYTEILDSANFFFLKTLRRIFAVIFTKVGATLFFSPLQFEYALLSFTPHLTKWFFFLFLFLFFCFCFVCLFLFCSVFIFVFVVVVVGFFFFLGGGLFFPVTRLTKRGVIISPYELMN